MLESALRYIRLGWAVFPLRGKIPIVEHGLKDASLNEAQVREWWAKWPNANIGIVTGHRFFALDIDIKKGGEDSWDMLIAQHGQTPDTLEAVTGTGGRHIFFALPDFPVKNSAEKIGPGLDIRGQGGYVVAAPSLHPETQKAYIWDGLREIEDQPIAPAPQWLLKLIVDGGKREPAASAETKQLAATISKGGRNDTLFRIASRLRRYGWSADEIFASLRVINQTRCKPPLEETELRTISDSAAKYPPNPYANVFAARAARPEDGIPAEAQPEYPTNQADVEAAVQDAIDRNDLKAAIELVGEIAKLPLPVQTVMKMRMRVHLKDFPVRDFEQALKALGGGERGRVIQMPPPSDGGGEVGAVSPMGPDLIGYPCTDSGNGERIVALFGKDLRFCIQMGKWLVWDGRRWAIDEKNEASQKAKMMARLLYAQAAAPSALSAVMSKWARTSESQASIVAGLKRASSEDGIPIDAMELDRHPYLLNCLNGVIDLRSGDLLPHDRAYLITKLAPIEYEPKAECPRFLRFLHWAMGDNPDSEMSAQTVRLVSFLQRAFGYALTGDVSEKAAFVFWGPKGNNGKTTVLTLMREMFPEYSAQISIDTLMTQRGSADAGLRADLADLRGARLVTTSEVEKEHRLSEGKLKYITAGMGKIKSCRKYENPIEFDASHKLFMDCNHRPSVRGTDDAIWRRLKPVPFEVSIEDTDPNIDKDLINKLKAEYQGILAWTVRGCQAWLRDGLGDPPEISQANAAWREHDDPLKEFMEDALTIEEDAYCKSADLSAAYAWWCKQNREKYPLGREQFHERIQSKGFKQSRSRRNGLDKQMRTWEGIAIKEEVQKAISTEGGMSSFFRSVKGE